MCKLIALGKDGKIHCVDVSDKYISCCECKMPIVKVNPDFNKINPYPYWCYECDAILDEDEQLGEQ